ncbi:hypothetical protein FRC00_008165, partial [Tulasnella sp. 408]
VLKKSCKGSVCEPGDEGYDNSKWAPNSTKPSKVIVTVEEVEDIAKAIRFARSQGLTIAVRGGGHSSSTASATDGLLIDMRRMTKIRIDAEAKIGYMQSGALIAQVEAETIKYGLAACAGLCSQVSIGGYTLGGGLGHSLGMYGLACDNLVSATIVLANGDIVQASESENPDLLWGLKGGYVYLPAKLEAIVATINEWRAVQKQHETICMLVSLGPDGNDPSTSRMLRSRGKKSATSEYVICPYSSCYILIDGMDNYHQNVMNTIPKGKIFVGAHIDNFDAPQVQKSWDAWTEVIKNAPFSILMYEFYPDKKVFEMPLESAAFGQRQPFVTVLCAIMGIDESDGFASHAWEELLNLKKIVSASSSQAAQDSLGYPNYGDPFATQNETDEYARKLFGSNYARLQQVKQKYDPEMVFDRWFAIRPAA